MTISAVFLAWGFIFNAEVTWASSFSFLEACPHKSTDYKCAKVWTTLTMTARQGQLGRTRQLGQDWQRGRVSDPAGCSDTQGLPACKDAPELGRGRPHQPHWLDMRRIWTVSICFTRNTAKYFPVEHHFIAFYFFQVIWVNFVINSVCTLCMSSVRTQKST